MIRRVIRRHRALFKKRHPPPGARPGTLVINDQAVAPVIRVMIYTPDGVEERSVAEPAELGPLLQADGHVWVDVQGLGDEATLRAIAEVFGIHSLALEDVVNVPQRPKAELYDEHLILIMRMARRAEGGVITTEQVSLFLGTNYVLTFQERYGDVLDPVRVRLRQGKGPMRRSGPDYLAYAILDAVLDGYYPILEFIGDDLETLESDVVTAPTPEVLQRIHETKRELLSIRRAVWPHREAVNTLLRESTAFVTDPVRVYVRDCYDHCVQIIEVVESYRELAGGLMDVYLSSLSTRQNEVMKVLTLMASIFIPLTFLAGIYGMNFESMPELHVRWAYPVLLAIMVVTALGMVLFFRHKGWIGSPSTRSRDDETDHR